MNPVITEEIAGTIRSALRLMETQDKFQIACFLYALGHANGCLEVCSKEMARLTLEKARLAA